MTDAGTQLRWLLFRLLEWGSELRYGRLGEDGDHAVTYGTAERRLSPLWIYVSTIGELNAIEPFLRRLLDETGCPPLVLLTDHAHYRDSFLARFPNARVRALDHRSKTAAALISERAPRLLVLAEIPCLLSDAPCRFPFALAYELKRRGVPVCMVNGWLYRGSPSCTMDAIEQRLFGREYARLFDLVTVQDDATRETLIAGGADPQRVFVTGNIKFDAADAAEWTPARARSPRLLQSIAAGGRPTIVAGCVTNIEEQSLALDAFGTVLRQLPDALLVLAPRHPEAEDRMATLRVLLAERGLNYWFKSEAGDTPIPGTLNCLVLDTMGELKDFYAAGTISYVGLNHNVLEPMAYGKPVVVTPGWEPVYPSFPVYQRLLAHNAIVQAEESSLGEAWVDLLRDPVACANRRQEIGKMLESLKGATARNMELLGRFGLLERADQPQVDLSDS